MEIKMENQLTFKEVDKTFPVPNSAVKKEEKFKYLAIEVTRSQGTTVFLKVPYSWNYTCINNQLLNDAIEKTIREYDWDAGNGRDNLDWQNIKEVSENEANQYNVFDVTKEEKCRGQQ